MNTYANALGCSTATTMSCQSIKLKDLTLCLHTAVDFVHSQGAGIGIVQEARHSYRGITGGVVPTREYVYAITRTGLATENVATPRRLQLLAVLHAMGAAHGLFKRGTHFETIVICSESAWVVETINHHVYGNAPPAPAPLPQTRDLRDMASAEYRDLLKRVVAGARRLINRCPEVSFVLSDGDDTAAKRARTLARRKGRTACKDRRRQKVTDNNNVNDNDNKRLQHVIPDNVLAAACIEAIEAFGNLPSMPLVFRPPPAHEQEGIGERRAETRAYSEGIKVEIKMET